MSGIELSMVVRARTASPTSMWTLPHSLSSAASLRAATRTRDRDVPMPTSSGIDLSCGGSSSRATPLVIEGAGDADMEACPIATFVKDASGMPPSVCPTVDTATCTDDGSGSAASTYNVEDTNGHATASMGTPDAPSFACSPMDAAISCASPVDTMAVPTPLTLTTGMVPAGS